MSTVSAELPRRSFGETMRADVWWTQPLLVFLGLGTFIVYSTWAAFQGAHYFFGNYISPFYSPEIVGDSPHSWFGPKPSWWPTWLLFSPALLILWAPGGFRLTCYYYRGAYYKAFWADPPACTVGEPRKTYLGERSFPLIMQNVHRYFLYLALIFIVILTIDVWKALWFVDPASGKSSFGIGGGTIVLAINVYLLGGYTFGCHPLPIGIIGQCEAAHEGAVTAFDAVELPFLLFLFELAFAGDSQHAILDGDLYVLPFQLGQLGLDEVFFLILGNVRQRHPIGQS